MVKSVIHKNKGFTLPELMIAMAVGSIIMAVIYSTYQAQQKSYTTQHLVVEMQQNIRAAMSLMKREIRMAGYDPSESSPAGILSAAGDFIEFSFDMNGDGAISGSNESLTYGFTTGDGDLDGIADDGAESLWRIDDNSGSPINEQIAYDIVGIAFAYAFDDDDDGQLDTSGGNVIWATDTDDNGELDTVLDDNEDGVIDASDSPGGVPLNPVLFPNFPVEIDRIRAVRIWVLARSRIPIRGHSDNRTYVVGAARVTPGDSFQRRLLVDTVNCRNMGL
jgi:type IV pilus assembly protein PilW